MGKKRKILQAFADGLDLPTQSLPGLPVAELWGDGRVLIENHRGITQYSREEIQVKVSYGELTICGSSMELTMMTGEQLLITGKIDEIKVTRRRKC